MRALLQSAQEERELNRVELAGNPLILVRVGRQTNGANLGQRDGEIIIIPSLVNNVENFIGHSSLDQNKEEPLGPFQNPIEIGVVRQVPTKVYLSKQSGSIVGSNLCVDKVLGDFVLDAFVGPPYLLNDMLGRDE